MNTELIGPFGRLLEVGPVTASPSVTVDRPVREVRLLSGRVRRQRAPHASRRWSWSIQVGSRDELSSLIALEQGVFGSPPWYWYDPMAARINMLSEAAALPGVAGADWWRTFTGDPDDVTLAGPVAIDGGRTVATSFETAGSVAVPADIDVPVVEGRTYTGSMFVADGDGDLELGWVDADRDPVGTPVASGSGSGRRVASGVAPVGAAGAVLTVSSDGRMSALQLTETDGPIFWHPGVGMPRVTIDGLQAAYRLVTAQQQLRNLDLELVEVG